MKTFTSIEWARIPADYKGVWKSERTDLADWSAIRGQYLGKRTVLMDGGLGVEGVHFQVVPTTTLRHLTCCVCDSDAGYHEQHHNRDTGYGICLKCVDWLIERGESPEDMVSRYGIEGVNYASRPVHTATTGKVGS